MILAVRTPNWIGDCVMIQPALAALKNKYTPKQVVLVTRAHLAPLFSPPLIAVEKAFPVTTIPSHRGWRSEFQAVRPLRSMQAERGILFTNSFVSALSFRMGGVHYLTGYRRDCRGKLLKNGIPWPGKEGHQVDAYMDLAAAEMGVSPQYGIHPHLDTSRQFVENVRSRLSSMGLESGVPWIGISPCAAYGPAKEWPHDRYAQLIRRLQRSYPGSVVILFGGPRDASRLDLLAGQAPGRVFNLAGTTLLAESIAAVSLCAAFVSNDSGMMHVAVSMGVPTVALFGPTPPQRVQPRTKQVRMIHHPVDCAPCNRRHCGHHSCMRAITVDEVVMAVQNCLLGTDNGEQ